MSLTDLAMLGICLGIGLVFLAILLEHRVHPRRRQKKIWRHKAA